MFLLCLYEIRRIGLMFITFSKLRFNLFKPFTILWMLVITSMLGCAGYVQDSQIKSQTDIKVEQLKRQYASAQQAILKCYGDAANTPDGKIVGSEVLYLKFDDPIRYQLASIKKTINSRQKTALNGYIATELRCRKVVLNSTNGLPHERAYTNSFTAIDQVYVGLLSGSMTIGEANVRKMEIQNVFVADLRNAGEIVTKNLRAMKNAELEQQRYTEQMRLREQVMFQEQMNRQVQQSIDMIGAMGVGGQPRISTNCNMLGNQMVCN